MKVSKQSTSPTQVKLTIAAAAEDLEPIKQAVLSKLAKTVKLQGFREGKAPANLIEKQIDQNQLQTEFLDQAVNFMYVQAIGQEKLRPVKQPTVNITKFVPFSTLELTAEVETVGEITLPSYKNLKISRPKSAINDEQIEDTVKSLQGRLATRNVVTRAAKDGDEVTIDFKGVDAKTDEPIAGADGNDYPLTLGSGSFIPGFEEHLVGAKGGEENTFTITFPADYGVPALQKKKVTFTVTIKSVQELELPKLDAEFAAKIGPFKSVDELRKDIRRELEANANQEADRAYENELVQAVAQKAKVEIPDALVDEELDRIEEQERQNVLYRGQTWQEHLDEEGVTAEEHRKRNREGAELRVRSGLVLGEIADAEKISVSPEELEIRMQLLKGRYAQDEGMMAELDKPESRSDIMSRMLTEKTLDKLKQLQN